ncbi:hypothetical protein [Microbacterium sulfonylureivorans]|uniref:hypothetical protein n=1 Tax=Microbacterium sulfonylureivorans TaxID=2486854 RepID=UPI000FD9B41F|nr:hypothetical protein [Microbacterium sulfonylureivorans]
MSSSRRQRIERVPGSRRAKLTPAPGTTAEPVPADERTADAEPAEGAASGKSAGPNDEQLRRDVPPHY